MSKYHKPIYSLDKCGEFWQITNTTNLVTVYVNDNKVITSNTLIKLNNREVHETDLK